MATAIPPVAVCLLALGVLIAPPARDASAQGTRYPARAAPAEPLARQWALRGVVVSDSGRSAVLEHLPSGRQALVVLGAAVAPSVSVVAIDGERVVLRHEGGVTTALRLGHGGGVPLPRARLVPRAPPARR